MSTDYQQISWRKLETFGEIAAQKIEGNSFQKASIVEFVFSRKRKISETTEIRLCQVFFDWLFPRILKQEKIVYNHFRFSQNISEKYT